MGLLKINKPEEKMMSEEKSIDYGKEFEGLVPFCPKCGSKDLCAAGYWTTMGSSVQCDDCEFIIYGDDEKKAVTKWNSMHSEVREECLEKKAMTNKSDFEENTRVIIDGERVNIDGRVKQAFAPKLKKLDKSKPSFGMTTIKKAIQISFFLPSGLIKKQLKDNPHGIDCVIEYVTQKDGYPREGERDG